MLRKWLCNRAALLALAVVTMLPSVSRADTLQGQPIYAQNNTNRSIWVAAQYVPAGASGYVTDGWWRIDPGQRVLILYNNGRYIYFHATDNQGTVWTGNDASGIVRGDTVNMLRQDTGTGYEAWTMSFNP